jgi:hypothetical protein
VTVGSLHKENPALVYNLPGIGTGVMVAGSEQTAVVAMIDYSKAPYLSTVHIVNKSDNLSLRHMDFPDDTIIATVDSGIVYLTMINWGTSSMPVPENGNEGSCSSTTTAD